MSADLCVIVGAGPGVSMAVARRFGSERMPIVLVARRIEKLQPDVDDLTASGVQTACVAADASDPASLTAAFDRIKAEHGDPSVLVYNVAASHGGVPSQLSATELVGDFSANVAGALVCAQHVIPSMRAARRGTILFTGGGLALQPAPPFASLAIGKAGLRSLAYSLGDELQPDGIHVATVTIAGSVQPGTPFDPDKIAETYWTLHTQPLEQWQREIIFRGE